MIYFLLFYNILLSNYFPFIRNDKMGYIDIKGEVVIEPIFDTKVNYFLSRRGNEEFDLGVQFPEYAYFNDGIAGIQKEKWLWKIIPYKREFGLANLEGDVILLEKVKNLFPSKNNFMRYEFNDTKMPSDVPFNSNLINLSKIKRNYRFNELKNAESVSFNKHLEHSKYIYIGNCNDNRILIYEYLSRGVFDVYFLDSNANKVIQLKDIVYAGDFSNSLALVKTNDEVFFIDSNGQKQFKNLGNIDDATNFNNQRAFVRKHGKFLLIDTEGNIVTENKFDYAFPFKNNYAKVKINSNYTLVDLNGNIVIEEKYKKFGDVYDDVLPVEVGSKWRLLKIKEKKLLFEEYDYISQFVNGLALAWKDKQILYINVEGNVVFNAIDKRTYEKKHAALMDRY